MCADTWESGIEQWAPHPGEKLELKPTEKGKGFSALQGLIFPYSFTALT